MGIALAVFYRQQYLGIFGGHAQQSRDPQPEDGTRTTQCDGRRDTGDITGTYCGSQSSRQRLEGRDFTLLGFVLMEHFADGVLHGIAELPELEAPEHHRQDNAGTHQQHQGRYTPNDTIQPTIASLYCL